MIANMETNLVSPDPFIAIPLHRRDFLRLVSSSAIGLAAMRTFCAQAAGVPWAPLGLDAHSLRAMRGKAPQLIDYAAGQKLDAVLLNSLNYVTSLDTTHLKHLKETANSHGMRISGAPRKLVQFSGSRSEIPNDSDLVRQTVVFFSVTIEGTH